MPRQLPFSHAAPHVQALVEALLAGHQQRDSASAVRIRAYHPGFADVADDALFAMPLATADAELVVAREYGFATWRQMLAYVNRAVAAEDFLQLACINYTTSDRPQNYQRANAMLASCRKSSAATARFT